jgi:hypothetical protein
LATNLIQNPCGFQTSTLATVGKASLRSLCGGLFRFRRNSACGVTWGTNPSGLKIVAHLLSLS